MTSPKIRSPSAAKTKEDYEKSSKKAAKDGAKNNHRDEIFLLQIIVASCWGGWRSCGGWWGCWWGCWGVCWGGLHPSDIYHQGNGSLEAVWPLLFCLNVKMISRLRGFALTVQFTFIHSFVILSSPSQWESIAHYHLDQKDNLSPFCGKAVLPALICHNHFRVFPVRNFKEGRVRSEDVECVDDSQPRTCIRSWWLIDVFENEAIYWQQSPHKSHTTEERF